MDSRDEDKFIYSLYINDKKVKTVGLGYVCKCKVIDINKKKKGKEIVFTSSAESNTIAGSFGIYKYSKGKLKKLGGMKYKYYFFYRVPEVTTNGKGIVTITADEPIILGIGSYYGQIKLKIKKGKLVTTSPKTIKMNSYSSSQIYTLAWSENIYSKPDINSNKIDEVHIFDDAKILKVKFNNVYTYGHINDKYYAEDIYAYIEYKNGKKGWIQIEPNFGTDEPHQFQWYPAWG